MPIGRHTASGLSLLLSSMRFFNSSAAHGRSGRPSLNPAPTFRNVATTGVPAGGSSGAAPRPRPGKPLHTPEKSGLPSAVLGAGAFRSGLPSGVLGTSGDG